MSRPDHAASTEQAVRALFDAIESRDLRAIEPLLAPDIRWQNVPHAAVVGREATIALLADPVTWADDVRWEIVSAAYDGPRAWVERRDRFLWDGSWYEVACNGVVDVDADGRVSSVRDYVDLGEWRRRAEPVLSRYASRSAVEVVQRHLDAVGARDVAAMAGDYALDAVLVRGESHYRGWYAIADYFDDALIRLGGRSVEFGRVRPVDDGTVETDWSISAGLDGEPATGRDTFTVVGGRIAHQIVRLDGRDF